MIENFREPKQASHKAWKAVCDLERKLLTPLQTIKIEINRKLGKYSFEKEEKARKEEELRIAAERKRIEEEAIKRAEELEKNGAKEEAAQALEEAVDPIMQPTPEPIEKAPKVEGIVHKTRWSFRIKDVSKIPLEFMMPDEKKIRQVVQSMKQDTKIPGIEIYQERTTDFRGC